ncbi:MAG TPA: guanylate kinase, partial [Gemmatimonadaceae bacterium]|nr:guanylate kinase [Gemmatimonadaceae bacterium]
PSANVLMTRLMARKTESESALRVRLASALKELEAVPSYQYVVVNDHLDRAVTVVSGIIDAEGARRERVTGLEERVQELVDELTREIRKRSEG